MDGYVEDTQTSTLTCPNCGGEMVTDADDRRRPRVYHCEVCGYSESR